MNLTLPATHLHQQSKDRCKIYRVYSKKQSRVGDHETCMQICTKQYTEQIYHDITVIVELNFYN